MVRDTEIQIVSDWGWLEVTGKSVKTRKDGVHAIGEVPAPPRLHIHRDGVTITGLTRQTLAWLEQCVRYQDTHDANGGQRPAAEQPVRVVFRL